MQNVYLVQLFALLLAGCGLLGLALTSQLFGTPLTRAEKHRLGDDWEDKGTVYRLPINLETIVCALLLIGGLGLLAWSKFEFCGFVTYWIPNVPQAFHTMLNCR